MSITVRDKCNQMDANSNASEIEECINVWKTNIKKEVKRQRLCSSIKLLFLVLALTGAILLLSLRFRASKNTCVA